MLFICGICIGYVIGMYITFNRLSQYVSTIKDKEDKAKANYLMRPKVYKVKQDKEEEYKPFVIEDKSILDEIIKKESEYVE